MSSSDVNRPEHLTTVDTLSMVSSGFLLLPGVIAAVTGTSAVLMYLTSALLAVLLSLGVFFDWLHKSER